MLAGTRYFLWYVVGDLSIFLVTKVARDDFVYWLPVEGPLGILLAFVTRVTIKIVTDYTGLIHFRHPYELGGVSWTINMLSSLLCCHLAIYIYYSVTAPNNEVLEEDRARVFTNVASIAWVASFVLILKLMKREFRSTFFSLKKGKDVTMDRFRSLDDAVRITIFKKNKAHWKPIRSEVKTWVSENWWRWKDEEPAWLTASAIAKIPEDFFPSDEAVAAVRKEKNARRGSLVKELVEGAAPGETAANVRRRSSATIVPVVGAIFSGVEDDEHE
jgi:hypothetical protein